MGLHLNSGPTRPAGLRMPVIMLVAVFCSLLLRAHAKPDPAKVTYLQNGDIKVGLSQEWGGGVCELWKGDRNYVDDNDTGRLIQSALFSHADKFWNPTQGGSTGNIPAGHIAFEQLSPTSAYSRSMMPQWSPAEGEPRESPIILEQWTDVLPDRVVLRYRWTNTGARVPGAINQETPVVYMMPKPDAGPESFNHVHVYCGAEPWTGDEAGLLHFDTTARKDDPAWEKDGFNFTTTEYWIAMTDEQGDGVMLFDPEWPVGHARRSHGIAPKFKMLKPYEIWGAEDPPGWNVRENTVYVFPGDWREARRKIAVMNLNRTRWKLTSTEGRAGWGRDAAGDASAEGLRLTNNDPELQSPPLNFSAARFQGIKVRYRAAAPATLQVTYIREIGNIDEEQQRTLDLSGDGQWNLAEFDFSADPRWAGVIRGLSFHARTGSEPIEISALEVIERPAVRWDFNLPLDAEGWFPLRDGDLGTPYSDGMALVGRAKTPGERHYIQPYLQDAPPSDGTHPRMASRPDLWIDAAKLHLARLRMRRTGEAAPPVLHWQTLASHGRDMNFIRSPHAAFSLTSQEPDGFAIYELNLSNQAEWTGTIMRLMLEPVTGQDAEFAIDWIEIAAE